MVQERFEMNSLVICCFLFGLFSAASAAGLSCKGINGEDVDWFVFYKIPKISTHADAFVKKGNAMLYMDPSTPTWVQTSKPISDPSQPVGFTLNQIYNKKADIFALYNDQLPPNSDAPYTLNYGHVKGAMAFDQTSGFWMVHSVPRFAIWSNSTYEYPSSGYTNGQIGLCLSLRTSSLSMLETIFLHINPWIYDQYVSTQLQSQFPGLATILSSTKSVNVKAAPWNTTVSLTTIGGLQVQSFSKYKNWRNDLYFDWVAQSLKSNLYVQTWQNNGENMASNCSGKYTVNNVMSTSLPFGISFSQKIDHSKWAVAATGAQPWVCIGDINRQESQKSRSGGTNCFQNPQVWKAINDAATEIEPCSKKT